MDQPLWNDWPGGVEWRAVDGRLATVRLLNLLLVGVPLTAVATLLSAWWWGERFAWLVGVGGAVLLLGRAVAVYRAVRAWGYAEREEHLLVRHGIWTRRLSIVPYGRMQFLDITADPMERIFKLSTVKLHTAAALTDATVPGLTPEAAVELRDRLAEVSGARAEGL